MLTIDDVPVRESRTELHLSAQRNAALAASVYSPDPRYYDDTNSAGPVAHPGAPFLLYFQSLEAAPQNVSPLPSVQAWLDLKFHRRLSVGERLAAAGSVTALGQLPPGASYVRHFNISNERGELVAELEACAIVPGRTAASHLGSVTPEWEWTDGGARWTSEFRVEAWDPNVFAECTGTFNPIHLSRTAAANAGLADRPYQGIAALLRALSHVVQREDVDEGKVSRIAAVFRSPVFAGDAVQVSCDGRSAGGARRSIFFHAAKSHGQLALARGLVESA